MFLEGIAIGIVSGLVVKRIETIKISHIRNKRGGYESISYIRGIPHFQTY